MLQPDSVGRVGRKGRSEDGHRGRNDVHQRHADDPEHVGAVLLDRLDDRRLRHLAVDFLLLERRRLVDPSTDDVTRKNHDRAEQERDPPTPALKGVLGQYPDNGRKTAAARICPACTPCRVKLVK